MIEKDTLQQIGILSHEIRNPLYGIVELSRLLLDTGLSQTQENYAKTILNTSFSLLRTLNDFVDFAKTEGGEFTLKNETFSPKKLLEEVAKVMAPLLFEKEVNLFVKIDEENIPYLKGDAPKIKQILFNLIGNAIKFTDNGSITLALDVKKYKENTDSNLYKLRFSVQDTGVGFDTQDREKLFQKFSQLENYRGGAGLGLCICKKIVDLMNGTIDGEAEKGKGANFFFEIVLPVDTKSDDASIFSENLEEKPCSEKTLPNLSILLVEDNPICRKVTALTLEKDGHKVITAINGKEALKLAKTQKFDLILMDMKMPEMDGIETAEKIRALNDEEKANVPIFAMTGNTMEDDEKLSKTNLINGFLQKPLDKSELAGLWNKLKVNS